MPELRFQEMHVVDHHHVEGPDLLSEIGNLLGVHRIDVVLPEIVGAEVKDRGIRAVPAQPERQSLHEMGLAEADPAEKVEGAGRLRLAFGDAEAEAVRQLVRLADDEILEGEQGLERCGELVQAAVAGRGRALRRLGGRPLQHRAHLEPDFGQRRVRFEPERTDTFAVAALDPVAHETRRQQDDDAARTPVHQDHRLQPALENSVPVFGLKLPTDTHPFDLAVGPRARHAGHSCFQGSPAAFQPQARPRRPSPSRSPSNPSETL